jgi:hypothetical protein
MTDQDFVTQEQAKLDNKLRNQLKRIERTGFLPTRQADVLWSNELIENCGHTERIPYNHYRLTQTGRKLVG